MKKKITSMVLALVMCFSLCVPAYAVEEASEISTHLIDIKTISGVSADSIESLSSRKMRLNELDSPTLSNFTLDVIDNRLKISGELVDDNSSINFSSSGNFFVNKETPNSGVNDTFILGDMSDSSSIHIVQLKIDKITSTLDLLLQNRGTEKLFYFSVPVSNDTFDVIKSQFSDDIDDTVLEGKINELIIAEKNVYGFEDDSMTVSYISPEISGEAVTATASGRSGWATFIEDLIKLETLNLSDYTDIVDTSFFTSSGWHKESAKGDSAYLCAAYTSAVGGSYSVSLALIDIVKTGSRISDKYDLALQYEYVEGVRFSYYPTTNTIMLINYNGSLEFYNIKLGIQVKTDKAIFTRRTTNGSYAEKGEVIRAAVALYSPLATMVDIFEHLAETSNETTATTKEFDGSYEEQYRRYGDKVIRGVAITDAYDDGTILNRPQHYLRVGGLALPYSSSSAFSWHYHWSATYRI